MKTKVLIKQQSAFVFTYMQNVGFLRRSSYVRIDQGLAGSLKIFQQTTLLGKELLNKEILNFFCFFVFFLFSFTSLSSFFTHIETDQSVGGAKTGVPGEKPPDTPASSTWLVPHVTRAPSEARTHIGEMIE